MKKGSTCLPYGWTHDLAAVIAETRAEASPAFALQTKFRAKAEFPKSETVSPAARLAVDSKRSKTDSHQGFAPTLEMCQQAIQAISEKLPRVGKMEFWDPQIISQLQQVFPEKHVHAVMACRGTERTMEPPKNLHAQEAPFRRMLMLRRDGQVPASDEQHAQKAPPAESTPRVDFEKPEPENLTPEASQGIPSEMPVEEQPVPDLAESPEPILLTCLAALETMPGPIGIKAQESPVEGGSGSKILEANFGATVVAETGSLPY
ncbi:unnamed protein product, partial [Cladocopium goreaui]